MCGACEGAQAQLTAHGLDPRNFSGLEVGPKVLSPSVKPPLAPEVWRRLPASLWYTPPKMRRPGESSSKFTNLARPPAGTRVEPTPLAENFSSPLASPKKLRGGADVGVFDADVGSAAPAAELRTQPSAGGFWMGSGPRARAGAPMVAAPQQVLYRKPVSSLRSASFPLSEVRDQGTCAPPRSTPRRPCGPHPHSPPQSLLRAPRVG